MDLDINPADLQFFDGIGLDLDSIISDLPDLDLDFIILFKCFHNVWFSFKIIVFNLCNDIMCYSDVPESFLSSQSHEPFESESSQSYLKYCRVESESSHKNCRVTSSHWFTSSSQCRIIQISNFSYIFLAIGPSVGLQWL